MTAKHNKSVEDGVAEYARIAEFWFWQKYRNPTEFQERLRAGLAFSGPDPDAEEKIDFATNSLSLFSCELFEAMICGGVSYRPMFVSIMWDRMLAAGLVTKAFGQIHTKRVPIVDHQIDERALVIHLRDGTFSNLFLLPARLPETYAHAVAAVDVRKNEDQARGTGFVVSHKGKQYFVTCKHNVDPDDRITIQSIASASGHVLDVGQWVLSERYDIAVARMTQNVGGPCFALSDEVEVFDEVFTLGYPLIPLVDPMLVGHRGEMNGRANLYSENSPVLLISNLVSPGSSGGPVLTRAGLCVGMISSWLESPQSTTTRDVGNEKIERMRFSAAIPANLLREAIESVPSSALTA